MRPRHPGDLERCAAILHDVRARHPYPIRWPADPVAWLTPDGLVGSWVATVGGALRGHACLSTGPQPGMATVERLFVDPAAGTRGLGSLLLGHAVAHGRTWGLRVGLEVTDADGGASGFYRRRGWREVSRVPIDWGGTLATVLIRFEAPD